MLVGRDAEVAYLTACLTASRPAVVVGEAGVGKTALLRAAAGATGRPVFEGGALATLSWMEHLPLRRALGRPVAGGDATAVAVEVERAVGGGVLVLDDLQWWDRATAEVVQILAGRVRLLAGVRRGEPGADPALDRLRQAGFTEMEVLPLDAESSASLVHGLRPNLSTTAVGRLIRRTGGNPLLLHELSTTGEPSASLRLALGARLRFLDLEGRDAFGLLALAARALAVDDLGPAGAKSLLAADLAVREPAGVAVRHALLAEVAIELMEPDERRRLHARLARVVEEPGEAARHHAQAGETGLALAAALRAADAAERPGERASHLAVAAGCASGPEADALRLRAARALDQAMDWDGLVVALDDITSQDNEARAWIALLRARAAWCGGGRQALRTSLAEGLALSAGTGTEVEVKLRIEESRLPLFADADYPAAVRMSSAALDLARRTGVDVPRAQYLLGTALGTTGEAGWDDHLASAMAAARRDGDIQTEFLAANNLISLHESIGSPARGRELAIEMIERARYLGLGYHERGLRATVVNLDVHGGAYLDVVAAGEALLHQPLDAFTRFMVLEAVCIALVDLGRFDDAGALITAAREPAAVHERGASQTTFVMAEAALWGGEPQRALELAEEFLRGGDDHNLFLGRVTRAWACVELGREPGPPVEPQTWPMLMAVPEETAALQLVHLGDHRAAAECFDRAAAFWQQYHRRGELRCAWAAGESLRRVGNGAEAVARLEAVEARAAELGMAPLLARIRRSLRATGHRRSAPRSVGEHGLTGREREVLALVAKGLNNAEIAARLGVSRSTVAAQVASASAKLGATSRGQAASLAGLG